MSSNQGFVGIGVFVDNYSLGQIIIEKLRPVDVLNSSIEIKSATMAGCVVYK